MPAIRAILFDLDGTIVDTEPAAAQAVVECFAGWGITADPSDARFVTGRTWEVALDFFYKKYPIPVPREQAIQAMLGRYRASMQSGGLIAIRGVVDAVRALSQSFRLCVVSGSHRTEILFALGALGIQDRFEFVLGAEDYTNSKPSPDGYLAALARLGVKPSEGLVFEDSAPGIESALAAGTHVVAVSQANHFGHNTSHAHERIADFVGIDADWVRALATRRSTGV